VKTVAFVNDDVGTQNDLIGRTDGIGSSMREREPGKWAVGMLLWVWIVFGSGLG
jgi:hypothetical protein